tara:strand:+ start:1505 stop:1669 length:165 start_codon:yes stop_codon:yes gene_type:complete
MKIDKQKLIKQINEKKSSHDIAMSFGVHPSTIRRKIAELGLKLQSKSHWRKNEG